MRSKNKIIIWPIYFDVAASCGRGRRIPKVLAIRAPKTEDIVKAAVAAGFKAEFQPSAAHPSLPWVKTGYVLIENQRNLRKRS